MKQGKKNPGILLECQKCTPPPLHKHAESQENDGQTRSRCLDKAVLARDVVPKELVSPKTCPYFPLSTIVITGH